MDEGDEVYCLADAVFFDDPARAVDGAFAVALPSSWRRSDLGVWVVHSPDGALLPVQGWKIHVSTRLDDATDTLDAVAARCASHRVPFKHVRDRRLLLVRNSKGADRRGSGKFITIYPDDEAQCEALLHDLGADLADQQGPDVLSDLRWVQGPLHVRYGAFVERRGLDAPGAPVPAMEDGDGNLVPDVRATTFAIPPWVTLPAFLEPAMDARAAASVGQLPYRIEAALHFSNGGGVYRAVDRRSGDTVVLKEARPHAGLSGDGKDAVARLHHERDTLAVLAGLDCVPAVREVVTAGTHHFLVLDHVPGTTLRALVVERYPLLGAGRDRDAVAAYTSWALDVGARVRQAVDAVHERGVVMGDLHPGNVLVGDDGRVVLVDWEVAGEVDGDDALRLGAPGFAAPPGVTGIAADRHALALIELFLFLPMTQVVALDPEKATQLAAVIIDGFPVPRQYVDWAVATVAGAPVAPPGPYATELEPTADGWERARDAMATAINASATPERDDRLFPGDPAQFERHGGVGLAHGAAGVLYAMDAVSAARVEAHEDWLEQRALATAPTLPLGFYDGLFGAAFVLERLGRIDAAARLVEIGVDRLVGREHEHALDIHGGLAGIALALTHLAPDVAGDVAEHVAGRLHDEHRVGLLHGSSGAALFLVRRYERTGDPALLDLAVAAVRRDLAACVIGRNGTLQVDEGWRKLPYLARGSVGIGVVIDEVLRHREVDDLAAAIPTIEAAATSVFFALPGLFDGRAGMLLAVARRRRRRVEGELDPDVADHVRRLRWHAVAHGGGLAFPGRGLLRLSMDLATGTAGVLLAVGAALHHESAGLPFLDSVRSRHPNVGERDGRGGN